jgi:LPXTG-motif cell wall-anchored protein
MNPLPYPPRPSRMWRAVVAATAVGATIGAAMVGAGPAQASSHREAPLIAGDPKVDNTDLYAFVSPDAKNSVTLIANVIPFEEPNGGPNFYPFQDGAHYDINIDNNGDAKADVIYRWTFHSVDHRGVDTFLYNNGPVTSLHDENLLFKQTYTLTKIVHGHGRVIARGTAAPSDVGKASMPDYASLRYQAITKVRGGGKSFAGQADDPFFADLRVFDLLYGGDLSETGQDTLKGYNVNTLALQVPKSEVSLRGSAKRNPVVGIWASTSKQSLALGGGKAKPVGRFAQVSRLGNPLVNEVVLPAGLKDAFNSLTPDKDAGIPEVVSKVTDPELPKLIEGIFKIPAPATPRNDLVEIFLTGIAKHAPTLDGKPAPIQADLNSQVLNRDVRAKHFRPSEMLRLNTQVPPAASPNRLGVLAGDLQGFPNGRRLGDDVIDISLQAVEGAAQSGKLVDALAAGDKVNANEVSFESSFPYVALPNTNSVNAGGGGQQAAAAAQAPAPKAKAGDDAAKAKAATAAGGAQVDEVTGEVINAAPTSAETGSTGWPVFIGAGALAALIGSGGIFYLRRRRPDLTGR